MQTHILKVKEGSHVTHNVFRIVIEKQLADMNVSSESIIREK